MAEITDDLRIAEAALARVLVRLQEIPPKDRALSAKHWADRVRETRQAIKNLERNGFLFDLIYSQKKRKK